MRHLAMTKKAEHPSPIAGGSLETMQAWVESELRGVAPDTYHREAQLLMMHATGLDKAALISRARDRCLPEIELQIRTVVQRRCNHEPVFRIIGHREFHGLELGLNAATLEPRDDTECLVELTLRLINNRRHRVRVLDLGTGTGAVVLALLSELPTASAVATDVSGQALQQARDNAASNELLDRLELLQSDWFSSVEEKFDFIVSNPPYICSAEIDALARDVKEHDPMLALDGGADGLDAYRSILGSARDYLKPEGVLVFEVGYGQSDDVVAIANQQGWVEIESASDLSGTERALAFGVDATHGMAEAGRI